MPEIRSIHTLELSGLADRAVWQAYYTMEDGSPRAFCFPEKALELKVAEYDLDTSDVDGVLDILFHEIHIPDPLDQPIEEVPEKFRTSTPAMFAHLAQGSVVPMTLFTAPTIAQAREAHLARIAEVKKRILYQPVSPAGFTRAPHPFDTIRRNPRITQAGVERHRRAVRAIREEVGTIPSEGSEAVDATPARRALEMAEDPENFEVSVAPSWAILRLSQE